MATINPHTTRAAGTILTAAIYNADHQVHITNANNLNNEAAPLDGLATNGLVTRTSATPTYAARTITAGFGLSVANGNGVSGNPSIGISAAGDIVHFRRVALGSADDPAATTNLQLRTTSVLTVSRVLTINPGNASRVLTIDGNAALNQDVRTTDSPTFNNLTLSGSVIGAFEATGNITGINFISKNSTAIFAPDTAKPIQFRPGGIGSGVNAITIAASTGNMSMNGTITCGLISSNNHITSTGHIQSTVGVFKGSASQAILGTQGPAGDSGSVRLRPNGYNTSANEVVIDANGNMTINGTLTVTG